MDFESKLKNQIPQDMKVHKEEIEIVQKDKHKLWSHFCVFALQ